MTDDLEAEIIEIITKKQKLAPGRVTADSTFAELGIESLDGMDLVFTFEERFHIEIPDSAWQKIRSVRDVVRGIRAILAERARTS